MADDAWFKHMPKPAENSLLFGHKEQQDFLRKQLQSGRLHHALLLEGGEGIGKAGFAFHFAYHLLSGGANAGQAAGWRRPEADSSLWRKMGQGAAPELLYISRGRDPKTQKKLAAVSVEDIRRISRYLQQTSADKNWRIVLIDPADDMNRNAANALLKTLEEPPAKTLFILISHNLGRLLPTIRSRCQTLRLKPLSGAEIGEALSAFSGGRFDPMTQENAALISLAEGSLRRALTLLAEGGVNHVKALNMLLEQSVFHVPQAQKLAEELAKRDNEEAYMLFLNHLPEFLHARAIAAAQSSNLPQAEAYAAFYAEQTEAAGEALAYNLDKKQFILVSLQKLYAFISAQNYKIDDKAVRRA